MRKIEKLIYPFAFSIFSYICLLIFTPILSTIFNGDFAALGAFLIILIIYGLAVIPYYCIRYSKIIQEERFKVLFAIYNALVIVGCYMLPLIKFEETYGYGIVIFVWALFWSISFLNLRSNSYENEENLSQKVNTTNFLLQNKKKNITAICITCLYIINLATDATVWQLNNLNYILSNTLPLFSAFLVLVFLFSKNIEYLLKKWLLFLALTGELVSGLFSICSNLSYFDIILKRNPLYFVNIIYSCLAILLIAVMLIGTLFNFKYIKLLKYGALGLAVLSVGLLIFELINVGGTVYHQIVSNGTLAINTSMVIRFLLRALYFVGIFILALNKRSSESV